MAIFQPVLFFTVISLQISVNVSGQSGNPVPAKDSVKMSRFYERPPKKEYKSFDASKKLPKRYGLKVLRPVEHRPRLPVSDGLFDCTLGLFLGRMNKMPVKDTDTSSKIKR
jgi:hypothetical protein